jgi:hypothetical protein
MCRISESRKNTELGAQTNLVQGRQRHAFFLDLIEEILNNNPSISMHDVLKENKTLLLLNIVNTISFAQKESG